MSIPPLQPPEEAGAIPSTVGILPQDVEAPESEPYLLSFKHYNEKECELNTGGMDVYSLPALKALKSMGTRVPTQNTGGTTSFGVTTERVHNANEYAELFKGIEDPEVDMREVKLEGKREVPDHRRNGKMKKETVNTGRIFFFPIESTRTLYLVAMRANHYETTKR